ncbi:putative TRASH domain protein [uncultured Desulfobacterium sp.]|uniref:Putative TRASH domain protein n=1 Tax=uncultured Desulfobacterium sp. TaxID=201089 RepID=A0A445MW51_9BACT|nr:putative TRASH domain protein [uncultured Desulfobacterium sp.]
MIRFLIFVFLLYLLYRVIRWLFSYSPKTLGRKDSNEMIDEMVQDPYCKTYFPLRDAKKREIDGKWYYFCSDSCYEKFEKQLHSREGK